MEDDWLLRKFGNKFEKGILEFSPISQLLVSDAMDVPGRFQ